MTSLASLLAIPPLSKVQLQSRSALRDARFDSPGVIDLPFWFFQCVVGEQLEIRSPGGFMTRVAPEDICDIVKAEPIVVQAMPRHVLVERLRMPLRERQQSPCPECYRPAHVLWVMKDKWERVDAAYVRFLDESLNEGTGPQQASLDDPSRAMLNAIARRDRGCPWSVGTARRPGAQCQESCPSTAQHARPHRSSSRQRFRDRAGPWLVGA